MPRPGTHSEAVAAQAAVVALAIPEVSFVVVRDSGTLGAVVIVTSQNALSGAQITSIEGAAYPIKVTYRMGSTPVEITLW
jgi:hypothetical protein